MDEIVQEFLVESYENLDQLDRDLVALEQDPTSHALLSSIFRTIHTIKGTSGFLAFGQLEKVAHVGENLLSRLRDGVIAMTPATTDTLLVMVDTIRSLLAEIERSGAEGDTVDVTRIVTAVQSFLDAPTGTPAQAPQAPAADLAPSGDPEPASSIESPATTAAADTTDTVADTPVDTADVAEGVDAVDAVDAEEPEDSADDVETADVAEVAPQPRAAQVTKAVPAAKPKSAPAVAAAGDEGRRSVSDSTVRVDVDLLDQLMRLVGELVLTRNQVVRHASSQHDTGLLRMTQRLNLVTGELQEGVMKTRMQPMDHIWQKLPRVVRDLSSACGKQVSLQMIGKDTELDRTLLEAIKDPLTHIVRNSIDHGIETPEERVAAGKPPVGTLKLRALTEGGRVIVEVKDDGKGIDPEIVGAKAVERGLITAAQLEAMTVRDILNLVFRPGFSTAEKVTNVSGRGVGMDVVKTNIEKIGGAVELEAAVGVGTTTRLTIPLTLAIVPALTVESGEDLYAVPQISLVELVSVEADRAATAVERVSGAMVYRLRGRLLPLIRLDEVLGRRAGADREGTGFVIAVLQAEGRRFGLIVDRVLNTEEIVVKPLGVRLQGMGVYSGATILGDGRVALILDAQAIAQRSLLADSVISSEEFTNTGHDATGTERFLLAAIGDDRRVAIPLEMVTRLEEFPAEAVEHVGHRDVVRYRGQIIPLLRLSGHLGSFSSEDGPVQGVVYSHGTRCVALVVDRILDIVEENVSSRSDIDDHGLTGSSVIQDRVTELLDVRAAILAADPQFFMDSTATDAGDESDFASLMGASA